MTSVYDIQALGKLIRDPFQRRNFLNAYIKKALPLEECPEPASQFLQTLEIIERHDSQRDGATKLVFQCLEDGARIEAVILRIASGRTSLCISSQVGCAAGCTFCATGKLGFIRNLTAAEMLDQVLLAKRLLREEGKTLRNVVVMGMGEPLRNEDNLFQCLEILRDKRFFNLSDNHLLVSTVGIPDAMLRFAERFPNIRLALSLHSARQEVREQIMPISKVHTLEKLRIFFPTIGISKTNHNSNATTHPNLRPPLQGTGVLEIPSLGGVPERRGGFSDSLRNGNFIRKSFMIEYLMLKGINDSPEDLEALKIFLKGTQAHINLIQFNAHPNAQFEPVTTETRKAFGDELKRAGFKVTLRYSLGDDIAAACGQLAGK